MTVPLFWCTVPFSRALAGAFSAGTFAISTSADACSCRKCSACSAAMQPATYKRRYQPMQPCCASESQLQTMTMSAVGQQAMQKYT